MHMYFNDVKLEEARRRLRDIENFFRRNTELIARVRSLIIKYLDLLKMKFTGQVKVRIMNFCGTHEWTTVYYGIRSILPKDIELVAGPGCPVCITPSRYIEFCIKLCLEDNYRVYTYGDTYKVPVVNPVNGARSLSEARSLGGDVVVVYSFLEAIRHVQRDRKRAVFLGIGFETIAPAYALMFSEGRVPRELLFLSAVRLTPPAAIYTLRTCREVLRENVLFGVIAPGHVSTITGAVEWDHVRRELDVPVVISGFEPLDVLLSIVIILKQLYENKAYTVIEYKRAVSWNGNVKAKEQIRAVFEIIDAPWRGIGTIPESGLTLKDRYSEWDVFTQLGLRPEDWSYDVPRGCKCGEIMLGLAYPTDCPLFLKACTPSRPVGPCMVSSEGTCSIWARYGGTLILQELARELELA